MIRMLPPEEWGRLKGRGPGPLLPHVPGAEVVVAESGGEIVATLAVAPFVHFEGVWIDPAHRNAGVVRGLLRQAFDVADSPWVVAGSADENMRGILTRLGAQKIAAEFWVLRR